MGTIRADYRVKVFCGIIYNDEGIFPDIREILISRFGAIDIEAGPFVFNFTQYYNKEMGEDLKRRFLSFTELVSPEDCYKWKYFTNSIEEKHISSSSLRRVNIDPGYMNLSKVVLLSTKDYFHRIFLTGGIFAELTLYYQAKDFRFFPWTYPDYRTKEYLDFFRKMRQNYSQQEQKRQ